MMFTTRCAGCDRPGAPVCTTCRFALLAQPPERLASDGVGVISAVPFTGRARDIVLGLKYRNRRRVARHLAGLLVNRLVAQGIHHAVDMVTWAPTTSARRAARGFDQGEVIARTVARQLGVPCRRLLERCDAGEPQTGRTREQRLRGPVFRARAIPAGAHVLVVDDVVTTGATLGAARSALVERGVAAVTLAAVAATPAGRTAAAPMLRRFAAVAGRTTGGAAPPTAA